MRLRRESGAVSPPRPTTPNLDTKIPVMYTSRRFAPYNVTVGGF